MEGDMVGTVAEIVANVCIVIIFEDLRQLEADFVTTITLGICISLQIPGDVSMPLKLTQHSRIRFPPSSPHQLLPSSKMPSARETVEATIAASPVVVFSKSYCPYCSRTKALLKELGASFEVVELDQIADGDDQQDALQAITGQRTVPNTFIGGKSVGGNSDIQKLHKDQQLVSKLQAVSAL